MKKIKRKQIDFGGTNVDYVKGDGSLDPKGEVIYCTFTEDSEAEDGSGTIDMTAKEIYEYIEAGKTVICRYSVDPTRPTYVRYIDLSVKFTNKQLAAITGIEQIYSVIFESIYNNKSYKITVVYTVSTNNNVASINIENEPPKTINHEVLTVNTDSNVHDGFYFPNAIQDYDGNWYGAVIIGDQVWLAENLKSLHYSDGTEIQIGKFNRDWGDVAYYPNNDPTAVEKYGMLYNWYAATRGVSASDSETPIVGISPGTQENNDNIWHIPSREELDTLCTYLSGQTRYKNNRAKAITVSDNPYDDVDVNKTGLNIPLSGWVNYSDVSTFGVSAYIYSSTRRITGTTMNASQSYFLAIHPSQSNITVVSSMFDYNKFSVRCVSDLNPYQFRNWYIQQYGSLQHHLNEAASEPANVNLSTLTIKKNNQTIDTYDPTSETDKTINIEVPLTASDIDALPDSILYGSALSLTIDPSTFILTGRLLDQHNNLLGTEQTIDLPLESVVVNGSYDSTTGNIILTLQNGNTITFPVTALVSGLQNVQPDWNQTDPTKDDYIKNKPVIPTQQTIPTFRTINKEQLTNSTLGDVNLHDGFYFPNAVKDYDGNWYGAVIVGDQVWLAENLRSTHYANGTAIVKDNTVNYAPSYYDYDNSNIPVEERGYLYNWYAVMNGASASNTNPSGVKGLSPGTAEDGDNIWHIPSDAEWTQLTNYIGKQKRYIEDDSSYKIAKALASVDYWTASTTQDAVGYNSETNNKTGFNAIPAGSYESDRNYCTNAGQYCNFWSSEESSAVYGVFTYMQRAATNVAKGGINKSCGYSVRCACDLNPVQFRDWYVKQYGSLQHHLVEDEEFVVELYSSYPTPSAVTTSETLSCNRTADEIVNAVKAGKKLSYYVRFTELGRTYWLHLSESDVGTNLSAPGTTTESYYYGVVLYTIIDNYRYVVVLEAYSNGPDSVYPSELGAFAELIDNFTQPDWNQTNTSSADFIKNKPVEIVKILHSYTDDTYSINKTSLDFYNIKQANKIPVFYVVDVDGDDADIQGPLVADDNSYLAIEGASPNEAVELTFTLYSPSQTVGIKNQYIVDFHDSPSTNTYPTITFDQIHISPQSDWNESNSSSPAYIKNKPTIAQPNNGTFSVKVDNVDVATFSANQDTNSDVTIEAGAGVTITKDTTNHKVIISSESNHKITSKTGIVTTQNSSVLYKYNILCELNDVVMSLVDLNDFSVNNSSNRFGYTNVYTWTKAASETGKYAGLCYARSTDGRFVGKLTINDEINNEVISYYIGIIVDTPPDATFTFVTNCSWEISARLDTDPNTTNYNLLAYLKIPDNFVGTISFTPIRRTIVAPSNLTYQVGCFDYVAGTTTIQNYLWKDQISGGTQQLDTLDTLLLTEPAAGTAGIQTPFGKYQVNIVGDFGGTLAVNDKISDFVVNDFYLHSMEERVRSITSLYNLLPNIPTPTVGDAGKVLAVDSSGNYVLRSTQSNNISNH